MLTKYQAVIISSLFVSSCVQHTTVTDHSNPVQYTHSVAEISDNTLNPDRGFYHQFDFRGGAYSNDRVRCNNCNLNRIYIILDKFLDRPISEEYLGNLSRLFETARDRGIKIIPRVVYHRPYGLSPGDRLPEAKSPDSDELVFKHIEQIASIFQEFSGTVSYINAGFIGLWGEWHHDKPSRQSSAFKRALVAKLRKELPSGTNIAIRYPNDRFGVLGDFSFLGSHNDCLGVPFQDSRYARSISSFVKSDFTTVQGGETCADNRAKECKFAILQLRKYSYDALNNYFHPSVISSWRIEGCFNEIASNLGYRLVFDGLELERGESTSSLRFGITNKGYGKVFNSRELYFYFLAIEDDAIVEERSLGEISPFKSQTSQNYSVTVENQFLAGKTYKIALRFPARGELLANDGRFAIRLSSDVEYTDEGMNVLPFMVVDGKIRPIGDSSE